MDHNPQLEAAYARFESQLPLIKLLVARVLPGYPAGPKPLVTTAATALWTAAKSHQDASTFGEAAEVAINSQLLGLVHFMQQPAPELPAELAPYAQRLEELVNMLGMQVPQMGLMPYYGAIARQTGGVVPYEEFAAPVAAGSEGKLLYALGEILRRRWPLILSIVLLTEVSVGVLNARAPKEYKATTTINTGIASGQSVSGTPIDWFKGGALMGNLTEMLNSRSVLERTIAKLNLGTTPDKLAKRLDVEKVGQTDIMKISATGRTPQEAADLANTHTQEFIKFYQQSQGTDARHADTFLSEQLAIAKQRLDDANEKLKAFKAQNVPEAQTTIAAQLADLRAQKGTVERSLLAAQSGLSTVETELSALKRDPMFARTVQDSTEVDTANDRLKTLNQNLADARSLYGDSSPVVKELKAQISKASGTVQSTTAKVAAADPAHADVIARRIALKVEIAQDQAKLTNINREITSLEPQAKNASIADVTYKQLENEVTIRQDEYTKMSERSSQARMNASGASVLPITVVDPAEPPLKPEDSKSAVKLALGALIAAILGFVLAYVLEVRARGAAEAGRVVEARFDGENATA